MAASDSHPPVEGFASPSTNPPRTVAQLIVGVCVLLLGAVLLVAGVVGIFMIRINGIGRLLGCGIVLGIGMLVHGWTMLASQHRG